MGFKTGEPRQHQQGQRFRVLSGSCCPGNLDLPEVGIRRVSELGGCTTRCCVRQRGLRFCLSLTGTTLCFTLPWKAISSHRRDRTMPGYVYKAIAECCPSVSCPFPFLRTGMLLPPQAILISKITFYQATLCNQNLNTIPTFFLQTRS